MQSLVQTGPNRPPVLSVPPDGVTVLVAGKSPTTTTGSTADGFTFRVMVTDTDVVSPVTVYVVPVGVAT